MSNNAVPEIIGAAGERAVRAYQEFYAGAIWTLGTRRVYRRHIQRFFRWAEARSLTLETIDVGDWTVYVAPLSRSTAAIVLSVLRTLSQHMVAAGVLTTNAFPPVHRCRRRGDRAVADRLVTLKSMRSEVVAEQTRLEAELAIVNELISIHENGVAEEVGGP